MSVRDILMAAAGGTAGAVNYIDDVFSTYLYTGTNTVVTINNGINLADKGGLVWLKRRNSAENHGLFSSNFGNPTPSHYLITNSTGGQSGSSDIFNFLSNGFSVDGQYGVYGGAGNTYASWTFRKQAKFFDVVTYTGDGVAGKTISHSLGSKPGCIIIKCIDDVTNWPVYNQALGANAFGYLSSDAAWNLSSSAMWNNTEPTATQFTVGSNGNVNTSGKTYVAYLFAHNAGGFGTAGTDNVISCGSFTTNSSRAASVNLGYEPQYLMVKRTDSTGSWLVVDVMRGAPVSGDGRVLYPNLSSEEFGGMSFYPTATGFENPSGGASLAVSATYIYIAIRRPMKPPTTGTSVFKPVLTQQSSPATITTGFPVDLTIVANTTIANDKYVVDRLRGSSTSFVKYLVTNTTGAEGSGSGWGIGFDNNTAIVDNGFLASSTYPMINWNFRRAPGFFDVVCYTGASGQTINHNLGVPPELAIFKRRSGDTGEWIVHFNFTSTQMSRAYLNSTNAAVTTTYSNFSPSIASAPTSTQIVFQDQGEINYSSPYVAYLFASLPGVSKVGSYTGNGTSQTINCGFSGGARFFLVKRTDSTGDWWVYDSARGIVSNADPALRMNSTAAEVTSADAVDPTSSGIIVNQESTCNINVNSATYIYLAIA